MKHVAWIILLLNLGVAAACAEEAQLKLTLSGTNAPSTVNLQTGTDTSEYTLAGSGALGQFTLRVVSAGAASPQSSTTCSGLYIPMLAGEGVLRSQDGSLLKLSLTGGSDCIDLVAGQAHCTRIFQIVGGTGRFKNASRSVVNLIMTVVPVVPTNLQFFAVTGGLTGTIYGVEIDDSSQRAEQ
jgi:hypothetical protein